MRKKGYYYIGAICILTASGIGFRTLGQYLEVYEVKPVILPRQLAEFPIQVGNWSGRNIPIPAETLKIAHNDDYLYRLYTNNESREIINLYIAYTARPRNMVGHNPQACYEGGGWVHDGTEPSTFVLNSGIIVPCLIHHFHRPLPSNETVTVLNYYVANGRFSNDERLFSGIGWRTPNIRGDASKYVAQIQISSSQESSVRRAAEETTFLILGFLPDENGKTSGTELINAAETKNLTAK
jgi:hypothetical protein